MFISIIIPVFNTRTALIQECLESIKYLDGLCEYEVVIVDDGSTQSDTCEFLTTLSSGSQFKVIHQHNQGPAAARNNGIRNAQGKYILPVDADDTILAEVSEFIAILKNKQDIDILFGNYVFFGDKAGHLKHGIFHKYDLWFRSNQLWVSAFFSKNLWEKVGGCDETFETVEDWDFWCRCAAVGAQFTHIPYSHYAYRIIKDGQSLMQKTENLVPEYHQKILDKLPLSLINYADLSEYVRYSFRKKPRKVFGLLLYLYMPRLYQTLCAKGWFSYQDDFLK